MCHASNEKRQTTSDWRNGTAKIKTRLERSKKTKPTNTWASRKLTPSKKLRWKKKLRENISGEPEIYVRQNYLAEILSKK